MNCGTSSAWWGCPVAQILLFCQLLYLLLLSTAKDITTNLRKVEFMWLNWTFLRGAVFFCFTFTLYTDNNRIILKRKYIIELHKLWAVDECQIYYFSVYGGLETRCCIGWIGYQHHVNMPNLVKVWTLPLSLHQLERPWMTLLSQKVKFQSQMPKLIKFQTVKRCKRRNKSASNLRNLLSILQVLFFLSSFTLLPKYITSLNFILAPKS